MYMRIVVGLDGSEFAEQVLPHVEALATKFGSAVTLLRATTIDRTLVHLPAHMMPAGFPATDPLSPWSRRSATRRPRISPMSRSG